MDLTPRQGTVEFDEWKEKRERIESTLEDNGLRYYRFGRVLPQGEAPRLIQLSSQEAPPSPVKPDNVEDLLEIIVRGLRRAMHPLTHRRKGFQRLSFGSEYDVQDLLHALLSSPWWKSEDAKKGDSQPTFALHWH